MKDHKVTRSQEEPAWNHESRHEFVDYYTEESLSAKFIQRFEAIKWMVLAIKEAYDQSANCLEVLDIGCNAGTNSILWAAAGHRVHGLDVNEPLLEVANKRSVEAGYAIDFRLGSATKLPWLDNSMDVCLMPELLEHVPDWESCLNECSRILKPGGVLFLSTTNKLCPVQQEFNLPLYSWYPAPAKRYFEYLAKTTKPGLAGHATYPAVNWFSYYGLREELLKRNMTTLDRFDILAITGTGRKATIAGTIRSFSPLRWLAHMFTPFTRIIAIKQ